MNIEFYLGKGSARFSHREVTILDVGTVPPTVLYQSNLAGTDELLQVDIAAGKICQLILRDRAANLTGRASLLNFSTNQAGISFPSGPVRILGIEDESSSSASSLSTSSSSTSSLSSGTSQSSASSSTLSSSSPSSLSSTSSPTSGSSSSSSSSSRSSSSSSVSSSSTSSASTSSASSSSSSS